MNTKSKAIQKYLVFSIALMMALIMALVGWRILGVWAAAATPEYPDPVETEIPPTSLPTIEPTLVETDVADDEPQPTNPEPTRVPSDEDAIRAALAAHFGMQESEFYHFEVTENTGTHAKGGVDNGYFLVAKLDGQWVFVAGGHSAPNCNVVAELGFPASMVPWCASAGSNMPDCEDVGIIAAKFIKDVTIADGSKLEPGEYFTKTWRIQNVGTCTWNSDYKFVFASGDLMAGPAFQSLANSHVPPGAMLDVSVQLRAPDDPGSYRGYWRFLDSKGGDFGLTSGGSVWVDIKVEENSSSEEDDSEGYTGYPSIVILEVAKDQTVTIKVKNLPPQDAFNVTMNYYGTNGENGIKVGSFLTGDGGSFSATFQIPDYLEGQSAIAIRIESPYSGYYAYNWFYNS
jgi:hypothetical protein